MEAPVVATDTWVRAGWEHFLLLSYDPTYERAKFYYNHGWMCIEMSPVGPAHARDNGLLAQILGIFALSRGLRTQIYITPSLRMSGLAEAQPDLAFYVNQSTPGPGTTPVDLAITPPPALAIEVSATTLADDLTTKRELYAQMGVQEYWVVDAMNGRVNRFGRAANPEELVSVSTSGVLDGLTATALEAALRLGWSEGDMAAMQYVLDLPRNNRP